MGSQHTGNDRSLLDGRSTGGGGSAGRRGSGGDGRTTVGGTSTEGVWDAEPFGASDEQAEETEPDTVATVDRDKLTDRQLEVLQTAYDMGYYEYPRGANASEVAEALDICPSTLAEHLAAAQTKLLEDVLGERTD